MRVLHVIDVLTLGGAQGLALRVMEGLEGRGVENVLSVLMGEERTDRRWELKERPVYLGFEGDYRRPMSWRRCVRGLERVIEEVGPDVVLSTNWLADVTSARACGETGVAHVAYLVDRRGWMESGAWRHRYRRRLTRVAFERAGTVLLAVSDAVADFVAEKLPVERERIAVVRNAIDVGRFEVRGQGSGARDQRLVVGMLGRMEEEKGYGVLLDAVAALLGEGRRVDLLIAGEGPLRERIEQRVCGPEFGGRVAVIDAVEDARDFYSVCDVFVVPSVHSEGLPTTILEAMASGCVVVASDVGGAREVIESGVNGLLVEAGAPTELARAIEGLIEGEWRRREMALRGREKVAAEFDVEGMIDRVEGALGGAASLRQRLEVGV